MTVLSPEANVTFLYHEGGGKTVVAKPSGEGKEKAFMAPAKASKKKKGGITPAMPVIGADDTGAYDGLEDLKEWVRAIEQEEGDEAQGDKMTDSTTTARA